MIQEQELSGTKIKRSFRQSLRIIWRQASRWVSRTISKYHLNLSSATIRNEMADREELDIFYSLIRLLDVFLRTKATDSM